MLSGGSSLPPYHPTNNYQTGTTTPTARTRRVLRCWTRAPTSTAPCFPAPTATSRSVSGMAARHLTDTPNRTPPNG